MEKITVRVNPDYSLIKTSNEYKGNFRCRLETGFSKQYTIVIFNFCVICWTQDFGRDGRNFKRYLAIPIILRAKIGKYNPIEEFE